MARRLARLAGVLSLLLASSVARGAPGADAADDPRTTAIYAVLGLATPVGVVGVEGVHRFGSRFQLSLGVGEGLQALEGGRGPLEALQWSLMPRLRLAGPRAAFTLGVGASVGRFALPTGEPSGVISPFATPYALWINFEIGGEIFIDRVALRIFGGYGLWDPGIHHHGVDIPGLPYLGVGAGYPF